MLTLGQLLVQAPEHLKVKIKHDCFCYVEINQRTVSSDPDPGGKYVKKKQKNCKELEVIVILFKSVTFDQLHGF